MNPTVVIDIGNSRMKWGRCAADSVAECAFLPFDVPGRWDSQCKEWDIGNADCVISDVAPNRSSTFRDWLNRRGWNATLISDPKQLPLATNVDSPNRVGIDRLFNAIAANTRRIPSSGAIVVDAGSAVTVDLVDQQGIFQGGAILPGFGLAAKSLHDYTAQLPLVSMNEPMPPYPGKETEAAIQSGIYWMIAGGVLAIIDKVTRENDAEPQVFLAGGDGSLLKPALPDTAVFWPNMTLEGIRLTALGLE